MRNQKITDLRLIGSVFCICMLMLNPLEGSSQSTQLSLEQTIEKAESAGIDKNHIERVRNLSGGAVSDLVIVDMISQAIDLAEKGMPTEFMMQKMLEGFAKGVPAGRMQPVLESIYQHTPSAVAISDRWMAKPEVKPFIDAMGEQQQRFKNDLVQANLKSLTQQVDPEQIVLVLNELGKQSVLEKTSPQAIAAAVGVLPDMPESVRNGAGIQGVIAKAVQGGFSAADIQKLPGAMNAAERRSQLPAASILNRMSDQIGNGMPANQVLQNLFNGNLNAGPPSGIPGRPNGGPGGNPGRGNGQGNGNGNSGGN